MSMFKPAALAAKLQKVETGLKGTEKVYVTIGDKTEVVELYVRKRRTIGTVLTNAGYTPSTTVRTPDGVIFVWRKADTAITVKNWLDGQYILPRPHASGAGGGSSLGEDISTQTYHLSRNLGC